MQRYLLDTNIVVRWLYAPERLPADIRGRLQRSLAPPMFSAVTPYELTLKANIGKLQLDVSNLLERLADCDFRELPLRATHAIEAGQLPLFHRDPFDRLLVAQARIENCILVTTDAQLAAFDVTVHHVAR